MRRLLPALLLVVLLPALADAQPPAGVAVTLEPNTPARGTTLSLAVDGAQLDPVTQRAPTGARLRVQQGFAFDARAVAERCTGSAACPAASRIGSGRAEIAAATPLGPFDVSAEINAFLAEPLMAGDVAGVVLDVRVPQFNVGMRARARLLRATAPYGLELRADDLTGGQALPAGITVRLKSLTLSAGTTRTVTVTTTKRKRIRRRKGDRKPRYKRVRVRRKVTYALITTPRSCPTGSWTAHVTVTFADGSAPLQRDAAAACAA